MTMVEARRFIGSGAGIVSPGMKRSIAGMKWSTACERPRSQPLVLPAFSGYAACIMSRQYTIRAVPEEVDRALRQRARREARSLNAVVVEALARGLELEAEPVRHTDLDDLIGTWQEDPDFDRAVADFERVDGDAWK